QSDRVTQPDSIDSIDSVDSLDGVGHGGGGGHGGDAGPRGAVFPGAGRGIGTGIGAVGDGEQARTATETAIASVVAELLEVGSIGLHENFFLLGGHSMLGAQLIVRLEKIFDVEITLRFLFDHPTVAEITAEVEAQTAAMAPGSRIG
ncbi:MAG TPA: phosphopantetheine-binding protein, partial [Actinomycetota bacterium]|nr:phosphopantetheine-binding protein [Actinomycetota bacterium]